MKLRYFILICATLLSIKLAAGCTLPGESYQWGFSNLDNYISNNCGSAPVNIIIPTNATISLKNNDPWDLTSYGAISITIEGSGSLKFNGTDELTMAAGGLIIINDITNSSALSLSGNAAINRISIGSNLYAGKHFSEIILDGGAPMLSGLPIELIDFYTYTNENNDVKLIWETASEIDNQYFEIEHSLNGIDFKTIGRVEGNGTTNFNQKYNYVHLNPSIGDNYYRLKQLDSNMSFEYFNVISQMVKAEKAFQVKINSLRLLSIEMNQPGKLVVYNMIGQTVFEDVIEEGSNDFTFRNFPQGNYIVNVFYSGIIEQVKISR